MSKEVKKYKAKAYADLSLQFYKDKQKTGCFLITSNKCKNLFNPIDDFIFSGNFASVNTLTKKEKLQVCEIFVRAKKLIEEGE